MHELEEFELLITPLQLRVNVPAKAIGAYKTSARRRELFLDILPPAIDADSHESAKHRQHKAPQRPSAVGIIIIRHYRDVNGPER
jgi:hypothetical protein